MGHAGWGMLPLESSMQIIDVNPEYVLDSCSRVLARTNKDSRSSFLGHADGTASGRFSEAWRLPIIDRHESATHNLVTFVHVGEAATDRVELICTALGLNQRHPIERIGSTNWFALSGLVRHGTVGYYRFAVDDDIVLDAVNPQRARRPDGTTWSRFFTHHCRARLTFEGWEWSLLDRLTDHILPFRTPDAKRWLDQNLPDTYRLDRSVGVVNYIDKVLAREEAHRLGDYRLALGVIRDLFRERNPVTEPKHLPVQAYVDLYEEMAAYVPGGNVPNWDHSRYGDPRAFLGLLRRHTWTGAFCHPSHGGNIGGFGWAFLSDRYRDTSGNTLFDWARSIEAPLGRDSDYRG